MLGRPPGRAARCVLRGRRPVPDLPHGARRVRRLPRRDPARARPLPPVPGDHQGADGRGPPWRRPRGRPRGHQAGRRRRRPRHAPGPGRERRLRPARRRRAARPDHGAVDALVADPISFTGRGGRPGPGGLPLVDQVVARHPSPRRTRPARSSSFQSSVRDRTRPSAARGLPRASGRGGARSGSTVRRTRALRQRGAGIARRRGHGLSRRGGAADSGVRRSGALDGVPRAGHRRPPRLSRRRGGQSQ